MLNLLLGLENSWLHIKIREQWFLEHNLGRPHSELRSLRIFMYKVKVRYTLRKRNREKNKLPLVTVVRWKPLPILSLQQKRATLHLETLNPTTFLSKSVKWDYSCLVCIVDGQVSEASTELGPQSEYHASPHSFGELKNLMTTLSTSTTHQYDHIPPSSEISPPSSLSQAGTSLSEHEILSFLSLLLPVKSPSGVV